MKAILLILISTASFAQVQSVIPADSQKSTTEIKFENITTGSLMLSFSQLGTEASYEFQTTNGIYISPYFYVGLGVGKDIYHSIDYKFKFIPVFINVRAMFLNKKNSPFVSLSGGYGFCTYIEQTFRNAIDINPSINSGVMFNPSVGVNIHVYKYLFYLFSVGYKSQQLSEFQNPENVVVIETGILF